MVTGPSRRESLVRPALPARADRAPLVARARGVLGRHGSNVLWAGLYPETPDHHAIVGPTAQLDGWWLATGWSGRGMLLGGVPGCRHNHVVARV